jgi:hypothetical protein
MCDDEHLAALMLDQPASPGQGRRISEWSPELEMLTNLYDRAGELIAAVVAAAGAKPPKVRPAARPTTALQRVRRRQHLAAHRSLVARLLPHQAVQQPPISG